MIEYKKKFLDKIKIFLSYFLKFDKDRSILSKKYLKNCKVRDLD